MPPTTAGQDMPATGRAAAVAVGAAVPARVVAVAAGAEVAVGAAEEVGAAVAVAVGRAVAVLVGEAVGLAVAAEQVCCQTVLTQSASFWSTTLSLFKSVPAQFPVGVLPVHWPSLVKSKIVTLLSLLRSAWAQVTVQGTGVAVGEAVAVAMVNVKAEQALFSAAGAFLGAVGATGSLLNW